MKIDAKHIIAYIICFILAFVVTVQMRTVNMNKSDILRLKTEDELRDEINQWKDAYNNLNEKANELTNKIKSYQDAYANSDDNIALMKKELDEANLIAGLSQVKGNGIIVLLDDTEALETIALNAGFYDEEAFLINYTDILTIINELTLNGAEAISINGQRVTSLSGIEALGPKIKVNNVNMSAPYEIKAIGNSKVLISSMNARGSKVGELRALGIDIILNEESELIIPAYERNYNLLYSSPIGNEGDDI